MPTDTTIILLASPSLLDLEVTISRLGTESTGGSAFATPQRFDNFDTVDPVFLGLADAAPTLRRLSIAGRQGPGPELITPLLRLTHLRELYVYNQSCSLSPLTIRELFGKLTALEVLFARIVDFTGSIHSRVAAYAPHLRDLRIQGTSEDLRGMLRPGFLDLPQLAGLSMRASESEYSPHSADIFALIASAGFARSLRRLTVYLINDTAEALRLNSFNDAASFASTIRPLFALKDLEIVDVYLGNSLYPFTDEDVLEIARAWKDVRGLHLSYPPFLSYPPLTALRHFSEHCPVLEDLSMTKVSVPETLDVPPAIAGSTAHPLRSLDLKMTFGQVGTRLEKALIAQYIDHYFPSLILCEPQVTEPLVLPAHAKFRLPSDMFNWGAIEQEIRLLRTQRSR